MILLRILFILFVITTILGCDSDNSNSIKSNHGFSKIDSEYSGLDFSNLLDEENLRSPFNYINIYLGGGASIGDVNNDGLQDIFLTSNRASSKLYINKGDFKFEDQTVKYGIQTEGWCSASCMVDINQDGWLDIYVCRSYLKDPKERTNLLFINNKEGRFNEAASNYKIDDENYSVGASFFDYDLDGDLDLVVANHPRYRALPLMTHYNYWKNPVREFSNSLFRNDGGVFTDVTEESGILSYGFSLAVNTSDIDLDGYPDIFITVDHDEPDCLFHNNGDGTFTNIINEAVNQTTLSSMGIDAGDVNHDVYPDLFVAEMLSEDHYREKVSMSMQKVDRFHYLVDTMGYKYYQMHNFLHLNNGNLTFSDVSQMSEVHKSDWSWSVLFMDYDNDSWQDLFVTNGWYREVYHKDRLKDLDTLMMSAQNDMAQMNKMAEKYSMSSQQSKIQNYFFKNNGGLKFESVASDLGITEKTISTGAAYGDLDNDGDLDLIINNLGDKALLYRNDVKAQNYIRFNFDHASKKTALGSKIFVYMSNGELQSREMLMTRGFQSSSEPYVHFGMGDQTSAKKVEVVWPDGSMQVLENVECNQIIKLRYEDANLQYTKNEMSKLVSSVMPDRFDLDYAHKENYQFDYEAQVLLPHKLSEYGPHIEVQDLNMDGKEDLFLPGAHGQSSKVFIQNANGTFRESSRSTFNKHAEFEDGKACIVDIDGDKDLDLVVSSTGYMMELNDKRFCPRIYLNDGKGNFKIGSIISGHSYSSSCIEANDIDNDGDIDLFIGGRLQPMAYPLPGTSAIFINDGKGNFTNETKSLAPELEKVGMVKDAIWMDTDGDSDNDLVIVGEWMPISIWENNSGKLIDATSNYFSKQLNGWWNVIEKADLDGNGLQDLIIGNLGLNYKYKASDDKPFIVYGKDFDNSGTCDIVLATYYGDEIYPVRGKSCSSEQIPTLGKKIKTFEEFALADLNDVYGESLSSALKYEANEFSSLILYQNAPGSFEKQYLPRQAQTSPINGIVSLDVDSDGDLDLITAGNLYQSEIETGRADAGTGNILINQGDRQWKPLKVYESGLYLPEDVKSLSLINIDSPHLIAGINNSAPKLYKVLNKTILTQ